MAENKRLADAAGALVALIDEERAALAKERKGLEEDKAKWGTLSGKLQKTQVKSPVRLNVGGQKFETSLATLQAVPGSYFSAMFSGRWEVSTDDSGFYFIDRDPAMFGTILNFMRAAAAGDELPTFADLHLEPMSRMDRAVLLKEAKFYSLGPLVDLLKPAGHLSVSTILTNKGHVDAILKFLEEEGVTLVGRSFELLYRGTRDGWGAANFHTLCDNKGATLVVAKSSSGHIFGGYTSISWDQRNNYVWTSGAVTFLFSITRPNGGQPVRIPRKNDNNVQYCNGTYGPTFGGGHDLHISNNNSGNYSNLGNTFNLPPDGAGSAGNAYLTGSGNFTLNEIEVFLLA